MQIELMANQIVLMACSAQIGADLTSLLEAARTSQRVQGVMDAKYKSLEETLRSTIDGAAQDQALLGFLESWSPQTRVN